MIKLIKLAFTSLGTFFIYLLGGWDVALQCLLIAIVLDYLTGIAKSYVSKKLNSNKGFKGIVKKLAMLCMVAIAQIIDTLMGNTGLIRTGLIYYLVANESLSIVENLGEMNIIVPKVLIDKLEQLKSGDHNE